MNPLELCYTVMSYQKAITERANTSEGNSKLCVSVSKIQHTELTDFSSKTVAKTSLASKL